MLWDHAMGLILWVDLFFKHLKGAIRSLEICIQNTIEYTKQRQVFGKPVLDNQYVHFRLAELQTEVELLRSLLYRITAMVNDLLTYDRMLNFHLVCSW